MFDDLVGKERRKTNRRFTVALAAALHAGAIALAVLWARQPPAATDVMLPERPLHPPPRGEPGKPPGVKKAEARKPDRETRKTPVVRKLNRIERVEQTIPIVAEPVVPEQPEAPGIEAQPDSVGDSTASADSKATGDGGGGGVHDGDQDGKPTGVSSTGTGSQQYEDVVTLAPGIERPTPSARCRPPAPRMPESARLVGLTGRVLVQFVVHGDGHVSAVRSLDSATPQILVEAVAEWLQGCPFRPALVSGRPVAVKMSQSFNFKLR